MCRGELICAVMMILFGFDNIRALRWSKLSRLYTAGYRGEGLVCAQISANDCCAVPGLCLTLGPIEEENKTDNNVYWVLNQSASVNLADTVLLWWDSKPVLP